MDQRILNERGGVRSLTRLTALLLAALAAPACGAADETIFDRVEAAAPSGPISSKAALDEALAAATGGETFTLVAGDYGDLNLRDRRFSRPVTIMGKAGEAVRFRSIIITNSGNLRFVSLDVGYPLAPGQPNFANMISVKGSTSLVFENMSIHGSLDGDPANDGNGLAILQSEGIRVVGSEFQQLGRALMVGSTRVIEVSGNRFHDLRSDGSNFADVQQLRITGNVFRDFFPADGDHPDAIQFWTNGTTRSSSDVLIGDNEIFQGRGRGLQGIFMTDGSRSLPYRQLRIVNNLVYVNDGHNGIQVQGSEGLVIENNSVLSRSGDPYKLWIRLHENRGATLRGNLADTLLESDNAGLANEENLFLDKAPARSRRIAGLNDGAEASADGLSLPGVGYRPIRAQSPAQPPSP